MDAPKYERAEPIYNVPHKYNCPDERKKKINNKKNIEKYGILDNMFWDTIEQFNWKNKDEIQNGVIISEKINLDIKEYEIFLEKYLVYLDDTMKKIGNICKEKKVNSIEVSSHIIGLGKNWYDMIMDSDDLVLWLIESNLYLNFDIIIKNPDGCLF